MLDCDTHCTVMIGATVGTVSLCQLLENVFAAIAYQ